jgi:hypothetical protein
MFVLKGQSVIHRRGGSSVLTMTSSVLTCIREQVQKQVSTYVEVQMTMKNLDEHDMT